MQSGPLGRKGCIEGRENGQPGTERNVTVVVSQQLSLACFLKMYPAEDGYVIVRSDW